MQMFCCNDVARKEKNFDRVCMSRIHWLKYLFEIFQRNGEEKIAKDTILRDLHKDLGQGGFFESIEKYSKNLEFYSGTFVIQKILAMNEVIQWDDLFNALTSRGIFSRTSKKTTNYPEINDTNTCTSIPSHLSEQSESILYLNLASCNLDSLTWFPPLLQILNVSSNNLSELAIPASAEFINANNNQITNLIIEKNSKTKELYLANNKLETITPLTKLIHLNILDLSDNCICYYEDVSYLSLNQSLSVFSLLNNPISVFSNGPIAEILQNLKHFDEANINQFSKCPHLTLLFNKHIQSHKRNYTLPLNFSEIPTKRQPCKPNFITPSRNSRASSPSLTNLSYTNKSMYYESSPLYKENMLERKTIQTSQRRSSSTLITPESIAQASKIKYGNPIAALMIKPGSKRRLQRKNK